MKYITIFWLMFLIGCKAGSSNSDDVLLDTALVYDTSYAVSDSAIYVPYEPPPPPPRESPRRRESPSSTAPPMAAPPTAASPPPAANGNTHSPSTSVPEETEVDAILDNLKRGGVVFDSPDTMMYRKSSTITVTLYPNVEDTPAPRSGQDTGTALVSSRMEAHLTGEGFEFEQLSPEIQAISGRIPTEWSWQVTPLQKGTLLLHLSLHARITVDGRETPYVLQTFERNIQVKITTGQVVSNFIGENWKWLWTALFIPIIGLLWKKISNRKKEQ